jgi:WD40 repeat protein
MGAGDPVAFSPDDRTLAASGSNHDIALWDVARRTSIASWQGIGRAVAFSRDWRLMASGSEDSNIVTVWSVGQHQQVAKLDDHTGKGGIVTGLAFNTDGSRLYSGVIGGVEVWDVVGRSVVDTLHENTPGGVPVAVSFDGRTLASFAVSSGLTSGCGDCNVILWDLGQRAELARLPGHTSNVNEIAFSGDGRLMVSADASRTVILWSVAQRAPLATLPNAGTVVAFSADGRTLATGQDGSVTLWTLDPRSWRQRLCQIAGRSLTHQEWSTYVTALPYRRTC